MTTTRSPVDASTRIPSDVFVEVVRLMIVGLFTAAGYELAGRRSEGLALVGAMLGACIGYVHGGMTGRFLRRSTRGFEERVDRAPAAALFVGAIGAVLLGGLGAVLGAAAVALLPGRWGWSAVGLLTWLGVYAGFQAGARKGEEFFSLIRRDPSVRPVLDSEQPTSPLVLVDSSVAIDGRLIALARSGFLPGRLAAPRFVLDELQGIADAADPMRRRRGRRALETLEVLRTDPDVGLLVLEDEVPEREEVDAKLVVLAKRLDANLLTVDENLARVAELQGVRSRSPNRLALSLQPALVPGETVRLAVSKVGRDAGQGVGYLEDGTMVVVSGGAALVGTETDVAITSNVQTARGRMFFASPISAG